MGLEVFRAMCFLTRTQRSFLGAPCLWFSRRVVAQMALVVALSTSAGFAQPDPHKLSRAECGFIETYDRENETYDFASDFTYMAHAVDLTATGCRDNCFSPLRKRTMDIEISLSKTEDLEVDAVVHAAALVKLFVEHSTGLSVSARPSDDPNIDNGGTIVFFAVNKDNLQEHLEAFSRRPFFARASRMAVSPGTTCFVAFPDWTDKSEPAFVFLNAEHHNTPEQIASCVREEAFNSLGLTGDPQGDDTLFSDQRWLGPELPAPAFNRFGERDYVMMRLFYRPVFEIGQSYEETLREVTQIIDQECRW